MIKSFLPHYHLSAACRSRRVYLRGWKLNNINAVSSHSLVGLLLGAIAGAVVMLLQPWCGGPLAALLGVLALALLTGGFHLDGLADTCDGIFSARRRERMLEIMRDSRLGTHGGLALIFVLVAKCWWSAKWRCAARRRLPRWRPPAPSAAVWRCC
jgi:hypothetical protein